MPLGDPLESMIMDIDTTWNFIDKFERNKTNCKYFEKSGKCKYGNNCRYKHFQTTTTTTTTTHKLNPNAEIFTNQNQNQKQKQKEYQNKKQQQQKQKQKQIVVDYVETGYEISCSDSDNEMNIRKRKKRKRKKKKKKKFNPHEIDTFLKEMQTCESNETNQTNETIKKSIYEKERKNEITVVNAELENKNKGIWMEWDYFFKNDFHHAKVLVTIENKKHEWVFAQWIFNRNIELLKNFEIPANVVQIPLKEEKFAYVDISIELIDIGKEHRNTILFEVVKQLYLKPNHDLLHRINKVTNCV